MKISPMPPTYSMQEAAEKGFASITTPYTNTPQGRLFLANVLVDMIGKTHCLIETGQGLEVGRLRKELLGRID